MCNAFTFKYLRTNTIYLQTDKIFQSIEECIVTASTLKVKDIIEISLCSSTQEHTNVRVLVNSE